MNCPAGTKVNFNKLVSTGCTREPHNSYKMCNAPGNAQKAGNPDSTGAWCCYGTWAKGDNCEINPSGKEICDSYWSCGNAALKTYAYDPICTAVAPSVVTLNSPANGSVATTVSVNLNWNAIDNWGTACAGNNNRYRVYIGANGATPTLVETTTSTSYLFTGTTGNTYYWYIQAHNGQLTANSETRNFLINAIPDPWWQVKDADISAAGDIISAVPAGFIFGENGLGGYPGIPVP